MRGSTVTASSTIRNRIGYQLKNVPTWPRMTVTPVHFAPVGTCKSGCKPRTTCSGHTYPRIRWNSNKTGCNESKFLLDSRPRKDLPQFPWHARSQHHPIHTASEGIRIDYSRKVWPGSPPSPNTPLGITNRDQQMRDSLLTALPKRRCISLAFEFFLWSLVFVLQKMQVLDSMAHQKKTARVPIL